MYSYVVIGLGRFGAEMALKLYNCGEDVLAIDTNDTTIDKIADRVTRAVVAVGSDLAASALITMNLKTLGVPYIICKAHDDTYREILEKLGADRVIIPEREIADRLAMGLTTSGVMEYIELSKEYGIVEMNPPAAWVGKTIRSLEVRTRYGANIIAVRSNEKLRIPPEIDTPLTADCVLVILGNYKAMEKLEKLENVEP